MLLSSTWDDDAVRRVGAAIGDEVREYGVDVLLAPGINLQRNPLCGRNFEYYSEDPLLSGLTAAAYIDGVQSAGVGTSIKHFAVNNQEINRLANDARVSQRALRELYLRNFEYAVRRSAPWTVMTSYNYVNGRYTSEDKELLTDILRDEWGYDGAVATDWGGGLDTPAQIAAGNDMIQPGSDERYRAIVDAVRSGRLSIGDVDRSVERILRLILRTPRFRGCAFSETPDLVSHAALTREVAAEGMVLLKNDGDALPLDGKRRIALFGATSYRFIAGGTGSGDVNKAYVVDLRDGMLGAGFELLPSLDEAYRDHMRRQRVIVDSINSKRKWYIPHAREAEIAGISALADAAAGQADAAVITIGRSAGEGFDRHVEDDYMLSGDELQLIEEVSRAFHAAGKRVVVILNVCGLVDAAQWRDKADAILIAWLPGQEGGNAVADVIAGRVSPGGHLPVSMPMSYDDVPAQRFPKDVYEWNINASFLRFSATEKFYDDVRDIDYTDYTEDIFVGYRHYATAGRTVAYPFGWGLYIHHLRYQAAGVEHAGRRPDRRPMPREEHRQPRRTSGRAALLDQNRGRRAASGDRAARIRQDTAAATRRVVHRDARIRTRRPGMVRCRPQRMGYRKGALYALDRRLVAAAPAYRPAVEDRRYDHTQGMRGDAPRGRALHRLIILYP